MQTTYYSDMESPVGPLTLQWRGDALTGVCFANSGYLNGKDSWIRDDARLAPVREQLEAYFRGERQRFDLPLDPPGTPFQRAVWKALGEIPVGETSTYGRLARRVGNPKAMRAVGAANGQNPIVVIIPCHRVIGADGSLTGFGGGLPRKRWLLTHEAAGRQRTLFLAEPAAVPAGRSLNRRAPDPASRR